MAMGTKSISTYRSRLMKKISCANSAALVRYAVRERIVDA
jgi:DNA-binding NarL/FixJ family response regulator